MRIAIVGPTHPYKGGIAQYTTELAHQLQAAGHDVRIESWSHQYPKLLYPGQLTVDVPERPVFPATVRKLSWRRPDSWVRRGRVLRREVDLVVFTVAAPVQMPAYRSIIGPLRRGARRPRIVAQCHNVLPHERRAVDVRLMRSVLSRVDMVVAHSDAQGDIARTLTKAPVAVATMAPMLVARAVERERAATVHRRLLFFGLVRPYKGLDVLLRAMAAGPSDVSLTVAGEFWGGVEGTEKLIADLGLVDRVNLRPGYVDASEVPALFEGVDALVLPYRSGTASFNAYLGFEHGVPVIATRVGTLGEDVSDGVDGVVAEPDDVDSLAAALGRFYDGDTPLRLRSGVRAPDATPAWERYMQTLLSVGVDSDLAK